MSAKKPLKKVDIRELEKAWKEEYERQKEEYERQITQYNVDYSLNDWRGSLPIIAPLDDPWGDCDLEKSKKFWQDWEQQRSQFCSSGSFGSTSNPYDPRLTQRVESVGIEKFHVWYCHSCGESITDNDQYVEIHHYIKPPSKSKRIHFHEGCFEEIAGKQYM